MADGDDFTYVLIPSDDACPFQELSGKAAICGDTLKELLKKHFAGGALTDLDSLRREYGTKIDEKLDALQSVANMGSVELLPLVRQSKTTLPHPNTATFLYYDEMGSLKGRPPNMRAFQLAKQCGVDLEHPLPGDVFIGRICCDPGPISISIGAHELDSSAPWIQQAPAENASWADLMKDFNKTAAEKAVGAKTAEEQEAENISRGWRWIQSDSDVEVTVALPDGTTKQRLNVTIGRLSLRVALKDDPTSPLVELKRLYAPVSVDESTWTLGSESSGPHVQVTLEKEEAKTWPLIEAKK